MAKYFLGSVGTAEAFKYNSVEDKYELLFVSKTLTDSGLNISTTKDDIRAGQGAPIQFSFYHDPSVEITLTDVLWRKEYLTAQLGAVFSQDAHEDYVTKTVTVKKETDGKYWSEIEYTDVKQLPGIKCKSGDSYIAWGAKEGTDDWIPIVYNSITHKFDFNGITGIADGHKYCVRYLGTDNRATQAIISSLIVPEELFLVITAPIFAGDACAASKGKAAGHITFEIPRFLLNGSQEFSMNMSSNQNMSLSGIALAGASADCDDSAGKLLRIIEVTNSNDWVENVDNLIVDHEYAVATKHPVIYALLKDGTVMRLKDEDLQYKKDSDDWKSVESTTVFATGTWKFRLKAKTTKESEDVVIG